MPITTCVDFVVVANRLIFAEETTWRREIDAHLEHCPPCRVYLRQLEDLRALLRDLGPTVDTDDPRVLAALVALETPSPSHPNRRTP